MNTKTIERLYKNPHEKNINSNFQYILFGGTGDLAHNKIIPAFYNLVEKDIIPQNFTIVATGRRYNSKKEYVDALYDSINKKKKEIDNRVWQVLADNIVYFKLNFKNDDDFIQLKEYL